jgi:hypothetical protein
MISTIKLIGSAAFILFCLLLPEIASMSGNVVIANNKPLIEKLIIFIGNLSSNFYNKF